MFCNAIFSHWIVFLANLLLIVSIAPQAAGQTNPLIAEKNESANVPEEIVVYGERNIIQLRAEVYRAEEIFLDRFNLLNSDNNFDFKCKSITFLGDRARKHVCVPRFAQKFEARMAAAMVRDGNFETQPRFRTQLKKMEGLLVKEMLTLIGEDEELREAQLKLDEARSAYEDELKERRQK